jgi:alpha-ketoglutarate-dependent taurine dioxygenase
MPATITVEPLTTTIGAEIGTVDLAHDLDDDTIAEVRQALLDWKVVFFRDQHSFGRDEHVAFGRRFGDNAAFTCGIEGMDEAEAGPLLKRLEHQAWLPDVQCRFRWRPGSVAFWDNRATQHCVSNDFLPRRRVMERVTVVGDRPY